MHSVAQVTLDRNGQILIDMSAPPAPPAPFVPDELLTVADVLPRHQATAVMLCASIHARVSPPPHAVSERDLILHDDRLCIALGYLRQALDVLRESDRQAVAAGPDPF